MQPCNGGVQRRTVSCASRTSIGSVDPTLCSGSRPWAEQACNTNLCMASEYLISAFDLRLLGPGGSRTDVIPSNGARFYQYDKANGAAVGVCIRADVQPDYTSGCSTAQMTYVATCMDGWRACITANGTQTANQTDVFNGTTVTSAACNCYAVAQV
jgi:hypothetical protein